MNGVDGGVSDEGVQDVAAVASSDDTPDDVPDFANMNGGPEVTAAASSSETASVTGRYFSANIRNCAYVASETLQMSNEIFQVYLQESQDTGHLFSKTYEMWCIKLADALSRRPRFSL